MKMRNSWLVPLVLTLAALACEGRPEAEPATDESTGTEARDMPPMSGMMDGPGGMMARMRSHMQTMQAMSIDSARDMIATHRQMVANMIARMNREMREMNMPADERWNATVDTLRQDLVGLPGMTAEELERFMPEHLQRVGRLMEMHERMTRDMPM